MSKNKGRTSRGRVAPALTGVVAVTALGLMSAGTAGAQTTDNQTADQAAPVVDQILGPIQRALSDVVSVSDVTASDDPGVANVSWEIDTAKLQEALGSDKPIDGLLTAVFPEGTDLSKVSISTGDKSVPVKSLSDITKADAGAPAVVGEMPTFEGMQVPELADSFSQALTRLSGNDIVSSIRSAAESLGVDPDDDAVRALSSKLAEVPDLLNASGADVVNGSVGSDGALTQPGLLSNFSSGSKVKVNAQVNKEALPDDAEEAVNELLDDATTGENRENAEKKVASQLKAYTPQVKQLKSSGLIPDSVNDLNLPSSITNAQIPVINRSVGDVLGDALDFLNSVIDRTTSDDPDNPDNPGNPGDTEGGKEDGKILDKMPFNEAMEVYEAVDHALDDHAKPVAGNTGNTGGTGSNNGSGTDSGGSGNGGSTGGDTGMKPSTGGGVDNSTESVRQAQNEADGGGAKAAPQPRKNTNQSPDGGGAAPVDNNAAAEGSLPVTGASSATPWILGIAVLMIVSGGAFVFLGRRSEA